MIARKFNDLDFKVIEQWYASRSEMCPPQSALPNIGFIVDGHAAGFLYVTDGGIAFIDNYITPEGLHFQDRDKALNLVTEALISKAKELNIIKLISLTKVRPIVDRSLKFGFDYMGTFHMTCKDLTRIVEAV